MYSIGDTSMPNIFSGPFVGVIIILSSWGQISWIQKKDMALPAQVQQCVSICWFKHSTYSEMKNSFYQINGKQTLRPSFSNIQGIANVVTVSVSGHKNGTKILGSVSMVFPREKLLTSSGTNPVIVNKTRVTQYQFECTRCLFHHQQYGSDLSSWKMKLMKWSELIN